MQVETILAAAKRSFKENSITMTAETHPKEFSCYLVLMNEQGKFWGALGEQK